MKKQKVMAGMLAFVMIVSCFMFEAGIQKSLAAPAEIIHSYKYGTQTDYLLLEDNTAQLGDGVNAAVNVDTVGTIFIPKAVTSYDAFEIVRTFKVSAVSANAFKDCGEIEKVHFEGDLQFASHALDGLAETVVFETNSTQTSAYGVAFERITYTGVRTHYVAFGDSIAAGYALPGYEWTTENNADQFPMPEGTFVKLVGEKLESTDGPAMTANQAVSGWTSEQL
ncbi:MAG: SGNH/GDSL hydrolase family protein, partial [Eubacterium sp.]